MPKASVSRLVALSLEPEERHDAEAPTHAASSSAPAAPRAVGVRRAASALLVCTGLVAGGLLSRSPLPVAEVALGGSKGQDTGFFGATAPELFEHGSGPLADRWVPCAAVGGTCQCTGTLVFSNLLGMTIREVNVDGEVTCTAEALGAPSHLDPRVCWCLGGIAWGDDVRSGLAAIVRKGLTPRIEIAEDDSAAETGCDASGDGQWYGCVTMSKRWDGSVVPQGLIRTAPAEEQLDMSLRKLDACHRMAPRAALRVLGVRSSQNADVVSMPVSAAGVCSVVWQPDEGVVDWLGQTSPAYCATTPGSCTTTPCVCQKSAHSKIELKTPQGQRCWACSEPGQEYTFRVNALAEQMEGTRSSWWPPSGINCPPILWAFMDWRACVSECPAIAGYFAAFVLFLFCRKFEERTGLPPWTQIGPLFGPPLKRGEVWRLFTYTFFHMQFSDLFQHCMSMLDALDIEGTPAIVLGDGSNLKCGVGVKQNFMCYPSIGMGTAHTLSLGLVSAAVGGACSTLVDFNHVSTGASALGFGLSGGIVALYGLYAGAELDQATSVQRSFQDWCQLRLIFVGFHIAMELVRAISQKDITGLFAHLASFMAGLSYVLYFLPPMGDGTIFPNDRPYVVPCAYQRGGAFADSSAPSCVRLFSENYEYEINELNAKIWMGFLGLLFLCVFNMVVRMRHISGQEAMSIGGIRCGAVDWSFLTKSFAKAVQPDEGAQTVVWCEVENIIKVQVPDEENNPWKPAIELRISTGDGKPASVLSKYAPEVKEGVLVFDESLFLPISYSAKCQMHLVLRDLRGSVDLAQFSMPITQVVPARERRQGDGRKAALQATAEASGATIKVDGAQIKFSVSWLDPTEVKRLRLNTEQQLTEVRGKFELFSGRLAQLKAAQASG
eukprot:TRINITY_DN33089_c0_g1_i1.p1 TRINITY_DN33089_c0_g1~~TRINITY_DN33089_c0_g1_i1.p1  ORF type:complete len:892 (-),score=219.09 TRINITY_DN33089_c0_g1_i1:127-2802(-)